MADAGASPIREKTRQMPSLVSVFGISATIIFTINALTRSGTNLLSLSTESDLVEAILAYASKRKRLGSSPAAHSPIREGDNNVIPLA